MTGFVRLALHHARLVAALAAALFAVGCYWVRDLPVDIFPNLAPTSVSIVTDAPGMVAEQVEQLVTRPVEYAALGAEGIETVHSESTQGVSVVDLTLQPGADATKIRDALSARLALANSQLPEGAGPAVLAPLRSGTSDILQIGILSSRQTPTGLRDIAQWDIRPRILATPGVSRAALYGGEVRRIEVRARSGDLADSDLGFADVVDAVHRATSVRGAGFIDTPNQRLLIDPHGQALTADDVAAGQIHVTSGPPTRIGDVSDVSETAWPANNSALLDGRPGILIDIGSQPGAILVPQTRKVEATIAALGPVAKRTGVSVTVAGNNPADLIVNVVRRFAIDLLAGFVLIALLLVALFRDARAAAISLCTIPIALLAALVALKAFGGTLNVMTMGGLVVALGLVADDAVLDVENIISDLRDAGLHHTSRPGAILRAAIEVRGPVVYATLTVVIALLPILLLKGSAGALLSPLALVVVTGCLAAIAAAFSVTPALSLLFLDHLRPQAHPYWLQTVKDRYDALLTAMARRAGFYLLAAAATVVIALAATMFCRLDLVPRLHDGNIVVAYDAPAGSSLAVMQDYGVRITQALKRDHAIAHVYQKAGRPDFGDTAHPIAHGELNIALASDLSMSEQDAALTRIKATLASFRGILAVVQTRLVSRQLGAQQPAAWVRVRGNDLDAMDRMANQVAGILRSLPAAGAVAVESSGIGPVVRIDLNFKRLALYGLSSADVLNTVQTAFQGTRAAQIFDQGRAIDIAVTAEANVRRDPEAVGNLLIRSSQGISAPLKTVANVYLSDGRTVIAHDAGLRRVMITLAPDRDTRGLLEDAKARITQSVTLPAGIDLEFGGDAGDAQGSSLLLGAITSAICVLALLFVFYSDVKAVLFVFGTAAFSLVGGVIAILAMGGAVSLGALTGFLVLTGISARNAILLLSRAREFMSSDQVHLLPRQVITIAQDRITPIVISALIIAASLLPMALHTMSAGMEMLGPMVIVILCGLISSTLMCLLFSPLAILWASGAKISGYAFRSRAD